MISDPFNTVALRESVLQTWRSSPTRLMEDIATEADLVRGGYRDRLLTELAQNAADAAVTAGVSGRVGVWVTDGRLHVANVGAPLTERGVQALAALRASGKSDGGSVGRFGVGFTAVLSVADEVAVRSRTGSVLFSAQRTRAEAAVTGPVPILRLVWATDEQPTSGWDTEIVLRLRDENHSGFLDELRAEAEELLLELPALTAITVADTEIARGERKMGALVELEVAQRHWLQFCTPRARWLLPFRDGAPVAAAADVLRAPTRSDEQLSLPAVLVADIAMQPDRRRILPGESVAELATGYVDFARALPAEQRLVLVPLPGFPCSDVDARLRAALLAELREQDWLPVVGGTAAPRESVVLAGLTPELAAVLGEVVAGLVLPALSGPGSAAALRQLGVSRIGLAGMAELLSGLDRPPRWWMALYDALQALMIDPLAVEELGALPVPLSDGRLVTGPRSVVLPDLGELPPVPWVRVVHPGAAHPLLVRLGAREVTAAQLLTDPALRAELADPTPEFVDAVLTLVQAVPEGVELPGWLGELELPGADGDCRPADELLLPDAPLTQLLADDAPFEVVAAELVAAHGAAALRRIGVGWGFAVLTEADPLGPDHPDGAGVSLDGYADWWHGLEAEPAELTAVRDLDLVAEHKWPHALRALATDPATARLVADRAGYTAWWLRRHVRIDGRRLGEFRHPDDTTLDGLLDEFDHPNRDELRGLLVDPKTLDRDVVQAVVDALADPDRSPSAGVIMEANRLLARAPVDSDDIALPAMVRAMTGALVEPEQALVLDRPWFGYAVDPGRLVVGDLNTAGRLATLLDISLVSEAVSGKVVSRGRRSSWDAEPMGVLLRAISNIPQVGAELIVHEQLEICLTGAVEVTIRVPYWSVGNTTHIACVPSLLAR